MPSPVGLLGGLLGGSTSIFGPALVSYTHALQLEKRQFVFYLGVMYLMSAVVQTVAYAQLGLFDLAACSSGRSRSSRTWPA